ncbi:MAG: Chemoreceptor mcpA Methyl-accepting chemotaxis protein [Hyphomicrobiales bacterium]|nr:Chemoreceptor mcpA Methyl-accepting chemotaxis protein [Hyphomicrobiales bacterium]
MNLTIARALNTFGLAVVLGCLIIAGAATYSLQQLRVGGTSYTNLIAGKDLVADVLPPPLYVIEAYLNATLMADEKVTLDEAKARFAPLRKDFNERRTFWSSSDLPSTLRTEVANAAAAAEKFWTVLEDKYLPALARQDKALVQKHGAELAGAYTEHRKLVDLLVTDANKFLSTAETAAQKAGDAWQSILLATAGVVLLFVIVGIVAIRNRVIRPLLGMSGYMARLADGTYDEEVPFAERQDEIGEMAHSVSIFRASAIDRRNARRREEESRVAAEEDRLRIEALEHEANIKRQRVIEALATGLEHIASGDLAFRLSDPLAAEYEKLRSDFNAAIAALAGTLKEISVATDSVHSGARDINSAADDLSRRTEQQAAALEETSAALNGIVDAVRKTSEMSDKARAAVTTAREEAEGSASIVRDAIAAMDTIEKSSREIGEIITMIDEIAFQTNLLALNAGVEAARAGDAGRGFAIVAQEVRSLAQRSTEAAKAIKGLISTSSNQIQTGVGLVRHTGEAFASIGDQVAHVTTLVEAIATSAHDQSLSLREVNIAVEQMDQSTQQNAAMVDQTTSASHSLTEKAHDLSRLVGGFKLDGRTGVSRADRSVEPPVRSLGKRLAAAFGR